jgi:hypothetical protein
VRNPRPIRDEVDEGYLKKFGSLGPLRILRASISSGRSSDTKFSCVFFSFNHLHDPYSLIIQQEKRRCYSVDVYRLSFWLSSSASTPSRFRRNISAARAEVSRHTAVSSNSRVFSAPVTVSLAIGGGSVFRALFLLFDIVIKVLDYIL